MSETKRLFFLVLVMTAVSSVIAGVAIGLLYQAAFEQQRRRLIAVAQTQARLIESVARFDQKYSNYPAGARAATLSQINEAHEMLHYHGLGDTGELVLAELREGAIHLIFAHPSLAGQETTEVIVPEEHRAEPLWRALSGQSGSMVALDYRRVRVLAAYEPVAVLDLGIVAKVNLHEIRAPFIRASLFVVAIGLTLIIAGAVLFFFLGEPIVRRLAHSEGRFRELFDNMSSGVAVYEAVDGADDFVFRDLNRAAEAIEDLQRSDVLGRRLTEVFPSIKEFGLLDVLRRVWRTGVAEQLPPAWYQDDRVAGWRENNVYKLPTGEIVALFRDESERIEANRRIRELHDELFRVSRISELSQIASALAHELMQPLSAAMNYVHVSRRLMEGPAHQDLTKAKDMTVKAADQIDRASDIIRSLRNLFKKDESDRTSENLNEIVAEAARLALASADELGPEVQFHSARSLPPVLINKIQIQQVIFNLVRNALDAMEHSVRNVLKIETCLSDTSRVEVAIHDTGPGIPDAIKERLFEAFFTTKQDGIGIGLSISRSIVTNHGGEISVEQNINGGATFRVSLPAASSRIQHEDPGHD